ncbi:hypothetical protein [Mycolicibacterium aichiense]|nr:hypothetical protein [Mycolicibacterium aichiense]
MSYEIRWIGDPPKVRRRSLVTTALAIGGLSGRTLFRRFLDIAHT